MNQQQNKSGPRAQRIKRNIVRAIRRQVLDFDFAACPLQELLQKLETSESGLSEKTARSRLEEYGYNEPVREEQRSPLLNLLSKFTHPLVMVLLIIGGFSFFFGETFSAVLVLLMAVASVYLTFIQEHRSGKEAQKLSRMVRATATVYRTGKAREIQIRDIVPGDAVYLSAGDIVPADMRIIVSKDLFINQASLTGESYPIEKTSSPGPAAKSGSATDAPNTVFMGSTVVSGSATAIVVKTGIATQFGELSRRLVTIRTETGFDQGIRRFTWIMIRIMLVLVVAIFAINAYFKGDVLQSFLFALAVAVGLTPQMLPMLVAVNLSKGAISMSRKSVIVKRLNSIQNFGAMDVLCTDKTGTLTEDKIILERWCNVVRQENEEVLTYAYINSFHQTGLKNLLDRAVLKHKQAGVEQFKKIDEIPFDFSRRIMSVVVESSQRHRLIAKGAPEEIFKRCTRYHLDDEILPIENLIVADLKEEVDRLSAEGFRVLAVAYKEFGKPQEAYTRNDESELILMGYVAFLDPPKPGTKRALESLKRLGIAIKVLTGDNELVTRKICSEVGIDVRSLVTGDQVDALGDAELKQLAASTTVFARLSPLQKERVIRALHENGNVVGYLGDGINDAPALKASDVGISVNNAADLAKESADIILLKKSLMVLGDGVVEGRRTFGNIVKYIKMGSSSNFGNMLSMTGASLILPFLPMAPIQILLNNFLYDISQVAIPTDDVDKEYLEKPRPWNVESIRRFMLFFGPLSSVFDFLTFYILVKLFPGAAASPVQLGLFQTGWFLESLCTQTLVIYIIRTGKIPFVESRPSKFLLFTSVMIVLAGLLIVLSPIAEAFKFQKPPLLFLGTLPLIVISYLSCVQILKQWFVRRYGLD